MHERRDEAARRVRQPCHGETRSPPRDEAELREAAEREHRVNHELALFLRYGML